MEDERRKNYILSVLYKIFILAKQLIVSLILILKQNIQKAFTQILG